MSDEQKISTSEPSNDLNALYHDTMAEFGGTAANSVANSPISMPLRRLFPKSVQAVTSDYIPLTNSIMPKGRSILAAGGGLSNNPVQYTNSRSFKNAYKGAGSLSSSKLLHGMKTGDGLEKGHSILNSGGGLKGMSLFKMKHYDPLPIVVEEAISGERVYDPNIATKLVSDIQQKKNQAKAKSQAAAYNNDVTDNDDDDDDNDDNTVFDDSSDDDQTDSSKSTNIKGDKGTKSSKATNVKGDQGGDSVDVVLLKAQIALQEEREFKKKRLENFAKHAKQLQAHADAEAKRKGGGSDKGTTSSTSTNIKGDKGAKSSKVTNDEGDDSDNGAPSVIAGTEAPESDFEGLDILENIADKTELWGQHMGDNNKKRVYIIQEKKANKWNLIMNSASTTHSFKEVKDRTKYTDNSVFNMVGNSVIQGKFRITLWTKDLTFSWADYMKKSEIVASTLFTSKQKASSAKKPSKKAD